MLSKTRTAYLGGVRIHHYEIVLKGFNDTHKNINLLVGVFTRIALDTKPARTA